MPRLGRQPTAPQADHEQPQPQTASQPQPPAAPAHGHPRRRRPGPRQPGQQQQPARHPPPEPQIPPQRAQRPVRVHAASLSCAAQSTAGWASAISATSGNRRTSSAGWASSVASRQPPRRRAVVAQAVQRDGPQRVQVAGALAQRPPGVGRGGVDKFDCLLEVVREHVAVGLDRRQPGVHLRLLELGGRALELPQRLVGVREPVAPQKRHRPPQMEHPDHRPGDLLQQRRLQRLGVVKPLVPREDRRHHRQSLHPRRRVVRPTLEEARRRGQRLGPLPCPHEQPQRRGPLLRRDPPPQPGPGRPPARAGDGQREQRDRDPPAQRHRPDARRQQRRQSRRQQPGERERRVGHGRPAARPPPPAGCASPTRPPAPPARRRPTVGGLGCAGRARPMVGTGDVYARRGRKPTAAGLRCVGHRTQPARPAPHGDPHHAHDRSGHQHR